MKKLVIAPYQAHRILFNLYRKGDIFSDTKFITKEELLNNYFGGYSHETIIYLIKNFGLDFVTARRYINNILLLDKKSVDNPLVNKLFSIKEDKEFQKLIAKNDLFKYELSQAEIHVHYYVKDDPYLKLVLNDLNVTYHSFDAVKESPYYIFENNDQELYFVFNKIEELLSSGVPSNKIFLYGLKNEDMLYFERLVKNYEINFNNATKKTLLDFPNIRNLVSSYSGNLDALLLSLDKSFTFYNDVIELLRLYNAPSLSNEKQIQLYQDVLRSKRVKQNRYDEAIQVLDLPIINDDEYLFIINYAQGIFPSTQKDDDIIDDEIKAKLNIPTSEDINDADNKMYQQYLFQKGNIYLCFPLKNQGSSFLPSLFTKTLDQVKIYNPSIKDVYSSLESEYQYANILDFKRKYRASSVYEKSLSHLFPSFKEEIYRSYNPQMDLPTLSVPLSKINLSYSHINDFYLCPFRYYLEKIVSLDDFEKTFYAALGNFAHEIFAEIDSGKTFEEIYEMKYGKFIKEIEPQYQIFLPRVKTELAKTFKFLKDKYLKMHNATSLCEENIEFDVDEYTRVNGRIDRIIFTNDYITLIDYKTGKANIKVDYIKYYLSLQLPMYNYLIEKSGDYEGKKILGIGIQPVFSDASLKVTSESGDADYFSSLRLDGFFLKDKDALSLINDFQDEVYYLKGVSLKNDGDFKSSNCLCEEDFFENNVEIVQAAIEHASYLIRSHDFKIAPKIVKGVNISCKYCKFQNLCYRNRDTFQIISSEDDESEEEGEDEE